MSYAIGTRLTCRETGEKFVVHNSNALATHYRDVANMIGGEAATCDLHAQFVIESPADAAINDAQATVASALNTQEGGDHYKKLGDYQPWKVLQQWLTPEEFRGYMKGTALAYLAREKDKGGMLDIKKAAHTLQALIELQGEN